MKKMICFLLAFVLLVSVAPVSSAGESLTEYAVVGGCIYFDKERGTIVYCDKSVTEANIPAEIEGVRVTSIGEKAFCNAGFTLTSVTIPDSVISIEDSAFSWCYVLNSVTIGSNVTYIGEQAFYCCCALTSITIPEGVDCIGTSAFAGCQSLESVILPDTLTLLGAAAFGSCPVLESITIPAGVTKIEESTFTNCYALESVNILGSVTEIGENAFEGCTSLPSITLPNSITTIDEYAFWGCHALTDVYFNGTAEEWEKIDFTKYNDSLLNALVHFSDGSVFSDVSESDYYAQPVFWAVRNGITNGVSTNEFAPDMICTRGQIVTFLYRACGSPEPTSSVNPFTDVSENAYYYKAVLWAVEKGITSGVSATEFAPEAFCTRAQAATFLYRSFGSPSVSASENPFIDVAQAYYYNAVLWAVENDITMGTGVDTFSPNDNCIRAQIVTFLYRAFT